MEKTYMVIQSGVAKKSGKEYSIAARIDRYGKNLDKLSDTEKYYTDDRRPLGTIIKIEQMEV